jgi:hypothetical protein
VGEREWNQRLRGKTGVPWLLGGNAAVAARERVENTGAGVGGGSTLRCVVRQGSALRSDRYAARKERAALTDASAAGVAGEEHVCSSVLKRTGVRLRSGRAAWEGPAAAQWE